MKIPQKLKIGGHWYKVLFPYSFKERLDAYGQHCWDAKEIRIAAKDGNGNPRGNSSIFVSFIHELLHAFDQLTGQELSKEEHITSMGEIIYQFLVDNKLLKK